VIQKYSPFSNSEIPYTRILSFNDFRKDRKVTIQAYLLELLASTDTGLTVREISNHSGIWVQSLTNPIKTLVDNGELVIIGIKKSSVSNRLVQVYGIPKVNADV